MDRKALDVDAPQRVFLWGALAEPEFHDLLGSSLDGAPFTAVGWAQTVGPDDTQLVRDDGSTCQGYLLSLDALAFERLDYFLVASSGRATFTKLDDGTITPGAQRATGGGGIAVEIEAAREVMRQFLHVQPQSIHARYAMMLLRASTRLRAASDAPERGIRAAPDRFDITDHSARQPYANYFTVEEHDLRFPRFDGTPSQKVTRAAFVGGDAVTILPYDPVRDRVLIIEQFRFAPFVRNDPRPWVLEPPAGRIDPGETPDQAARREMAEETGIAPKELIKIASYYPSPGAWTEYLYSYVGVCDLPQDSGQIGGLDGEDEDIYSHILSASEAFDLMQSGECDAGPLWLSLMWLMAHKDRLRATA